jgi:serine/threonine protein kinase
VLGAGGMGRVYLGRTPAGAAVAVKLVHREYAEDEAFRKRFEQEVATARRVQGLYTVPVVDADTETDEPWLATAYVPGPSLQHAVTEHGPLPASAALRLIAGVAEALESIHAAGVIHRDLKPSNVILTADGPKVIDFGIARAVDLTSITGTGAMPGTPAYMAPEQILGQPVTPAADVFALGVLTNFAATGQLAFAGESLPAVMHRILQQEPELNGCPEPLSGIATACLDKEPQRRPTPAEVIRLCGQTATARPAPTQPDTPRATVPEVPVAVPVGGGPPPQQAYPQAPHPQRPASSGIAITATVLCTISSLLLVWSGISVAMGNAPVDADLPVEASRVGNGMWTLGDILLIVGTILLWTRQSAGRLVAIIGVSMVLAAMLGFELAALSASDYGTVTPLAYLINVFTVLSLVFLLLPSTGRYLKAKR